MPSSLRIPLHRLSAPLLLCAFAATAAAQGVVNPSLLAPQPDDATATAARATDSRQAVRAATGAVVYVAVEVEGPRGKFVIERPSTGVLVGDGSMVVTWTRLIAEAQGAADKALIVQWPDDARTRVGAELVRSDAATGLSLLRLAKKADGARALPVAGVDLEPGLPITVLGCPEGSVLVAFEGVVSSALAQPPLAGHAVPPGAVWLTDARSDPRCDGAAAIDGQGRVVGLCGAEYVRRDVSEPTLEDLRQPSFLAVLSGGAIAKAFAAELGGGVSGADLERRTGVGVVAASAPCVVGVYGGEGAWPAADPRDPGATMRGKGVGSGVVLSTGGLIVTNNHLVPGDAAQVALADGTRVPAKVIKRQGDTNLALLQVQVDATKLHSAMVRDGDEVLVGERVFAIGRPFGGAPVVSAGVLSAVRGGGRLQADPDLGNANAGGAVVDGKGHVIGIADGGAFDPLAVAFAMRGDRVTKETNLSTFVGMARVRRAFSDELAAAGLTTTTPFQRTDVTDALTTMVDKVAPALLNVYVGSTSAGDEDSNPFASVVKSEARVFGLGSGVIIDQSGLALSNWHVVDESVFPDGAAKPGFAVEVSVFGGRKYPAKVLSISRENDLALLQLELQPGETVHAVELGNSTALEIGERVVAIGNPHGKANTITAGIVTAKEQGIRVKGRWAKLEHLIETDAAINGGNSGGALLDMTGRLVGINSAGGGTFNNRGYAISVDHVRRQLLGLLLQAYKLRSPDLGMSVTDDGGKVLVSLVDARGPAAKAGVQSGDRIVAFAGETITWSPGLARVLLRQQSDLPVPLVLERKGNKVEVVVTPVAAAQWALIRQSGLACRDLPFAEAPEQVRAAAIATHRKFTGDNTGEPAEIPAQLVRIEEVFAGIQKADIDLRQGDLLVGVMLRDADTGGDVLVHIADVDSLKRLFNDRQLGDYEGQEFRCWICRGGKIHEVDVVAKRLFW
ncbi:MAG: trypsin-like peptidase domain-containing protein [Planctomycetes bacterium]|nr:trypsin-like peptidase domain-containing protein [Planctomycetota bacterium]MCB9887622.1 trypsin-like peptidase domain-containing protein [Planctomycetota bacterium]